MFSFLSRATLPAGLRFALESVGATDDHFIAGLVRPSEDPAAVFVQLVLAGAEPWGLNHFVALIEDAKQASECRQTAVASIPTEMKVAMFAYSGKTSEISTHTRSRVQPTPSLQPPLVVGVPSMLTSPHCLVGVVPPQFPGPSPATLERRARGVASRSSLPLVPSAADAGEIGDAAERSKWAGELAKLLVKSRTPIARSSVGVASTGAGRRAATLRKRVYILRPFFRWLRCEKLAAFPQELEHVTDYFVFKAKGKLTRNTASEIKVSIAFAEMAAGVEEKDRVTKSKLFKVFLDEFLSRLPQAPPVHQAPRPLLVLLAALEDFVMDNRQRPFYRAHSWWILVKTWGVLRHADHGGFRPADPAAFRVRDDRLRATIFKTKTTGGDKRVRSRPVYICEDAWLKRDRWLATGWQILARLAPHARDYLMPTPADRGMSVRYTPLSHAETSAASMVVFSKLVTPFCSGVEGIESTPLLISVLAQSFWTEHSLRSFLPTATECFCPGTKDVGLVGCWKATGGAMYIRLVRSRVARVQKRIRRAVVRGNADAALHEGESREDLDDWLLARGVTPSTITKQLMFLTFPGDGDASDSDRNVEIEEMKGFVVGREEKVENKKVDGPTLETDALSEAASPAVIGEQGTRAHRRQRALKDLKNGFYVARTRDGKCMLHFLGGCFMVPGVDYAKFSYLGESLPDESKYTGFCAKCRSATSCKRMLRQSDH